MRTKHSLDAHLQAHNIGFRSLRLAIMPQMTAMIEDLFSKGHAYEAEGHLPQSNPTLSLISCDPLRKYSFCRSKKQIHEAKK